MNPPEKSMGLGVLLIGNFLTRSVGVPQVCEALRARLEQSGCRVVWASDRKNRILRLADMLRTALSQRAAYQVAHVDVFSGRSFVWAEYVCRALRLVGRPYVLTLHGGYLPGFAAGRTPRVRRLLGGAAAVTVPSPYLLQEMSVYRRDLRLLPNPLTLDAYAFRARTRARPLLAWLRAYEYTYNPTLAVQTAALLLREFPDLALTMAGPTKDDSAARVRNLVAEAGAGARVTVQGPVPKSDVPSFLDRGDIFLNTADFDNAPVSVMEAMACGLCVVSTNVGGIPYLLTDGADALLVPPRDPAAMAGAVRRILTEPGLCAKLSRNGRKTVEPFDWSCVLPQWLALLRAVAAGAAPAR